MLHLRASRFPCCRLLRNKSRAKAEEQVGRRGESIHFPKIKGAASSLFMSVRRKSSPFLRVGFHSAILSANETKPQHGGRQRGVSSSERRMGFHTVSLSDWNRAAVLDTDTHLSARSQKHSLLHNGSMHRSLQASRRLQKDRSLFWTGRNDDVCFLVCTLINQKQSG